MKYITIAILFGLLGLGLSGCGGPEAVTNPEDITTDSIDDLSDEQKQKLDEGSAQIDAEEQGR